MKKMKKVKNLFILLISMITIISCGITDEDTIAVVHDEAGALIRLVTSPSSSILGNPESGIDLKDAIVSVTNASLDLKIELTSGNLDNISKIEVLKSYNGSAEVVLGETTTLPYDLIVDNLNDLISGTNITPVDLRIGDVLKIRVRVTQTDGDVYYYNSSSEYNLVVNCSSNLAGTYTVDGTSGRAIYNVIELSPGKYQSDQMLGWPTSGYWVNFTDTCGILSFNINEWRFSGGNPVSGEGYVDSDGNLVWTSVSVAGTGLQGGSFTMVKN